MGADSRPLPLEIGEGDVEDVRDAEERGELDLFAVFGSLVGPAGDAGRHPYLVLGEVLAEAFLADASADGPMAFGDPVFVVGQVTHPLDALVIKPRCLPNLLGILRSTSVWRETAAGIREGAALVGHVPLADAALRRCEGCRRAIRGGRKSNACSLERANDVLVRHPLNKV